MTTETKALALQSIGESAYASIEGMVDALNVDYDRLSELKEVLDSGETLGIDELMELDVLMENADGADCKEDVEQRIWEDPLSIEVRSDWHTPGAHDDNSDPTDFRILLSTGGPATRIIGELNQYGEPCKATLQVQDWFTTWTDYEGGDEDVLLEYCARFYFEEG